MHIVSMGARIRKRDRRRGQVRPGPGWVYLAAATLAAVAVAAAFSIVALSGRSDGDSGGQVVVPTPGLAGLVRDGRVLGQPDAPVSIVEYADFQ